jgi:predicted small integral membrane protein
MRVSAISHFHACRCEPTIAVYLLGAGIALVGKVVLWIVDRYRAAAYTVRHESYAVSVADGIISMFFVFWTITGMYFGVVLKF